MADILNDFPINASAQNVFQAVATPAGLDSWWTLTASGQATEGAEYELGFGPGYDCLSRINIIVCRATAGRCISGCSADMLSMAR